MESILDFSQPLDVAQFDRVVEKLSNGSPSEIMQAQEILTRFRENPDAFFRVDKLLSESTQESTKFIALQILEQTILQRWNSLDSANQGAVRGFVLSLILRECQSTANIRRHRALLTKLNTTLVSIAKREWPVRWPTFISDIASSAAVTEPMVENNLNLFRLIGEEIFEFGACTLTSRWAERKRVALAEDFREILSVCQGVLLQSQEQGLLRAALETLTVYVPWISPSLTIQPAIVERLTQLMVGQEAVRGAAVRCFTEFCSLKLNKGAEGDQQRKLILQSFEAAMGYIVAALPTSHSGLAERVVELYERGNDVDQAFLGHLALLLIAFLKSYYTHISYHDQLLIAAHECLVGMSNLDDKEVFKSCVEYWFWLGEQLTTMANMTLKRNLLHKLKGVCSAVRFVLIRRMARPEEVILVEEDGELRREQVTDVEEVELHAWMRQTLGLYTQLEPTDTRDILVRLMQRQLDRSEWSWHNCNTLCWATGAIAGVLPQDTEAELFTTMLVGLMRLCKEMAGKENRAVIASDIMFVAARYKRYLQTHPHFLFTVVRKVFEFMRETFPGVQDMAVDTFAKLAGELAGLLVQDEGAEEDAVGPGSCAHWIAGQWPELPAFLSHAQLEVCFGAVGHLVAAERPARRVRLLETFLAPTNARWREALAAVHPPAPFAEDADLTAALLHLLRSLTQLATTAGEAFLHEMHDLRPGLFFLYHAVADAQRAAVAVADVASGSAGAGALSPVARRRLAGLKRELLRLCEAFVRHSGQLDYIAAQLLPDLFAVVLVDYRDGDPAGREAAALALTTACVETLGGRLAGDCAALLDAVFPPTVAMVTAAGDGAEPAFRVNLFRLLGALTTHCFVGVLEYAAARAEVVEGMLWAIRHRDYPTMSTGLQTLDQFLAAVVAHPLAEAFYRAFLPRLFEEVLHAAMDFFHAAGFVLHCRILRRLFSVSALVPAEAPVLGREAVTAFLIDLLSPIPTITRETVVEFVGRCYRERENPDPGAFETVVADFLIEVQVWGAAEENRLQAAEERRRREETIPGFAALSTNEPMNPFLETAKRTERNGTSSRG